MLKNRSTIIGSLPHADAAEALDCLDRHPLSIPTWPQLPRRSFREAMITQYSEGFPGVVIDESAKRIFVGQESAILDQMADFYEKVVANDTDSFALSPDFAGGFREFIERRKTQSGKLQIVKGHVTGPFTFGLGLNDVTGKAVWFDPSYRDIVLKGLAMKALWQIRQLEQIAEKVIVFFDEPIFSALGTPAYMGIDDGEVVSSMNEIFDQVHAQGALTGVHCCGNMDWGLLTSTNLDILAFDAFFFGDKVALYPQQISSFLERGGHLAWGIVPTSDEELLPKITSQILHDKMDLLIKGFVDKGLNESRLRNQSLFTPSCGMGTMSPDSAERVLTLLSEFTNNA